MTRPRLLQIGNVTDRMRVRFEAEFEVTRLFDTPEAGRAAMLETRQAMGDLTCDNLSQYLKDGTVLTSVPECRSL
ncbi:hypothetical protein [Ruegeria marina]|uniref:Uncharacterized protein n=1 Tax=Ruegeria marina TaxID=639004 RepID=A0A1G6XCH1_9RHOB|nr:hypothetical protein [Ruegeria marina]SDD74986.1 hypothetical protein SAMN04488239_11020 [Ruegeria marina]